MNSAVQEYFRWERTKTYQAILRTNEFWEQIVEAGAAHPLEIQGNGLSRGKKSDGKVATTLVFIE